MKTIFSVFKSSKEQRARAFMLFFYQFLAVSIIVQGRIIRDTLFLKRYDTSKLPFMYMGVALFVSTLVFLYSKYSIHFRIDKLIIFTFLFSIAGNFLILFFIKSGFAFSYPLLYIFVEVSGAFMMFQFWSFTNELLDSREAKKMLGFVGGGGVIASLSTGFAIGFFVKVMPIENVLLINIIFMILAGYIVFKTGEKYKSKLRRSIIVKKGEKISKGISTTVFSSKYIKYIALITAFVFVSVTLVDYQFKMEASRFFGEKKLAVFLGNVYAIFGGLFSFLFQLFMTSTLLNAGIFISLSILPLMFLLSSASFLALPHSFVLFSLSAPLLAVTMAKASDYAFRYTINDAATQLLYIPLDSKIKSRAKAMIDGIIKPVFIGISGVAIYLITLYKFNVATVLRLISFSLLAISFLWLVVILFIRKEYLVLLINKIKTKRLNSDDVTLKAQLVEKIIIETAKSQKEDEIIMALDMLEKDKYFNLVTHYIPLLYSASNKIKVKIAKILREMDSRVYTFNILQLLREEEPMVLEEAIMTYGYIQMEKSIKVLEKFMTNSDIRIVSATLIALIKYCGISGIIIAAPKLNALLNSKKTEERLFSAYILGEIGQETMSHQVFDLLNDKEPAVRREAVKASQKIGSSVFVPKLFLMLLDKQVAFEASKALASFKEKVLIPAESILNNTMDSFQLKFETAKMLGEVTTEKSVKLLLNSLENQSVEMRDVLVESLKRVVMNLKTISLDDAKLEKLLINEFQFYFQLLYYKQVLMSKIKFEEMLYLLETKLSNSLRRIFSILSISYGNKLFDTIYFNVSQKSISKEQKSNAIELIDNILDKEFKKILIPLIEISDENEKLKFGYENFMLKERSFNSIMEVFVTDDNHWVRSITLFTIAKEQLMELSDRVENFFYDPSPLVRETALYTAHQLHIKLNEEEITFLKKDHNKNIVLYLERMFPKNKIPVDVVRI